MAADSRLVCRKGRDRDAFYQRKLCYGLGEAEDAEKRQAVIAESGLLIYPEPRYHILIRILCG